MSIRVALGADVKLHMYGDVLERTFHQFGQGEFGKQLPAIVQQRIIDLILDGEIDQDQLVDRGIPELFQMSKATFSLLLNCQLLCLYRRFRPDVPWRPRRMRLIEY